MWVFTLPGVFSLSVDDKERVSLDIKKPQLAQYEANQLADALVQAGQEISYFKIAGVHRESRVMSPKS